MSKNNKTKNFDVKQYQVIYRTKSGDRMISVEEAPNLETALMKVRKHLEGSNFVTAVSMDDRVLMFRPECIESFGIRYIDPEELARKVLAAAGDNKEEPKTDEAA